MKNRTKRRFAAALTALIITLAGTSAAFATWKPPTCSGKECDIGIGHE